MRRTPTGLLLFFFSAALAAAGSVACSEPVEADAAPDGESVDDVTGGASVCAEEREVQATPRDCHPRVRDENVKGAYFRKVTSASSARHTGLTGEGVLPKIRLDRSRWLSTPTDLRGQEPPQKVYAFGPLDVPSVYMGGRAAEQEVDAGLAYSRVFLRDGRAAWTDVVESANDGGDLAHRFTVEADGRVVDGQGRVRPEGLRGLVEDWAFRPFWRVREWANPSVSSPQNRYFHPGQSFRMSIRATGRDSLVLRIDAGADDRAPFEQSFTAPGFGRGGAQSWKRVNSIDLSQIVGGKRDGREGAAVIPTATQATGARWSKVVLLGAGGVAGCKLACGAKAITASDTGPRYDFIFGLSSQDAMGAETLDINPPDR